MKQKLVYVAMTMALLPFVSNPAFAGNLSGLDDFTPEGKVYADDMNQKMQDITDAVNDNNKKIDDHIGNTDIHHDRYTDTEAQEAMGEKGNDNALNHDRYTDEEVKAVIGDKGNNNALNHDRYTDTEALEALSSHVNDPNAHHFTPLMWASIDNNFDTEPPTVNPNTDRYDINTIKITNLPDNGFLVIAGLVYIENNSTSTQKTIYLIPRIDDQPVLPSGPSTPGWAAKFIANTKPINTAATGTTNYAQTLSYTITVPITVESTAGEYTVSQDLLIEGGTTDLVYNTNHLTVTYYPQQLGTIVNPPSP